MKQKKRQIITRFDPDTEFEVGDLAPVPDRGKRCEPAHTRLIAEQIAQLRGVTLEQIAAHTTETARKFFKFTR